MTENQIGSTGKTLMALASSKAQLEALLDTFEAIENKLDPAPAPYPDLINPNIFFHNNSLQAERNEIEKALVELENTTRNLRKGISTLQTMLCNGRNKSAWSQILERASAINSAHFENVAKAIKLYEQHACLISWLATYANADCLPDDSKE